MSQQPTATEFAEHLGWDDARYQRYLQAQLERSGLVGDVFPLMVSRNVPQYLLRRLWPAVWSEFEQQPRVIMFGAAEEGWRGRVENIQARVAPGVDAQTLRVSFRKTYVMNCTGLLLLARPAPELNDGAPDDVLLVWLPQANPDHAQPGLEWQRRTEPGLTLEQSGAQPPIYHHIVTGDVAVTREQVLRLGKRAYATTATQLPRREISSMALLALAILRHAKIQVAAELLEHEAALLQARAGQRLGGATMEHARAVFQHFFALADAQPSLELHALWQRIREMADQAR